MLFFFDDHAAFEIPSCRGLGTHPGAGEIGGAEEGALAIDDDAFHVIARTEDPFEAIRIDEVREAVEILPETRSGFFRVDETNLDAVADKIVEHREESVELPRGPLVVKVFDVSGRNPDESFRRRNQIFENRFVNLFIENNLHLLELSSPKLQH